MRKFTLLTSVLLTAPFAVGNVSAQCVTTQDCASLGYTENSCENGGIKCPFGNAWACKSESCDRGKDNPDCTYGSIYYHDGTCIKEFVSGRIPIGVIVYDDDITHEKWIMALDDTTSKGGTWSTEEVDIPEITNYTIERTAVSDLKSCENTEAMLALGESKYPAAAAAKNYAPVGAENTKGKWCLPSAGIWNMVNNHRTEIDAALLRVNGISLNLEDYGSYIDKYYWSSSENSSTKVWSWVSSKGEFHLEKKDDAYYYTGYGSVSSYEIRPVMKI